MAEEKDYRQSNKERMLMALALLFPEYKELSVWDWSKILDKKPLLAYKAQYIYDKLNLGLKIENTTRIPEKTVFETAAKISQQGFNETVKETTLTQKYAPVEKTDLSKPDPSKSNTPLISKDTTVIDKSEILFSSNIVKYDKKTIEYIVFHEFCHLKYRNHTKKFYELLEKYYPNYRYYANKLGNTSY